MPPTCWSSPQAVAAAVWCISASGAVRTSDPQATPGTESAPTQPRTYFNANLVTIVLGETLTKAEHAVVDNDHSDVVLATRKDVQDVMGVELITPDYDRGRRTERHDSDDALVGLVLDGDAVRRVLDRDGVHRASHVRGALNARAP